MAPVKRPRVESSSSAASDAGPASKRPRAVPPRVNTGLRGAAAAPAAAAEQAEKRPLKRPPLPPRQPGHTRPAAPRVAAAPKVDSHSRPAAVSADQLEAWRTARRQKLAERILRGRAAAGSARSAAACLGMNGAESGEKRGGSRPRAVPSRLLQPRSGGGVAVGAAREVRVKRGREAKRATPPGAEAGSDNDAVAMPPPPAPKPRDGAGKPPPPPPPGAAAAAQPPVAGIRLNKAAERRVMLMQQRRRQDSEERRRTLAGPPEMDGRQAAAARRETFAGARPRAAAARPAPQTRRETTSVGVKPKSKTAAAAAARPQSGATRRETFAGARPKTSAAFRPQTGPARRETFAGAAANRKTGSQAAPVRQSLGARRSPRGHAGSSPRVTAVKTGLSRARLAELARPKAAAQKAASPKQARVVKPVERPKKAATSVGGFLAPPGGQPNTMRRSLSAMHRSHSTRDRSVCTIRPEGKAKTSDAIPETAGMDETGATSEGVSLVVSASATPGRARQSTATPGRPIYSTATPGRPRQSTATPGRPRQSTATPGRPRQSTATPGRPRQSTATPGRPRQSTATPGRALHSAARPALPSEFTLQQRLEQWLAKRGKQLSSFRHLHCFGREVVESMKTPAKTPVRRKSTYRRQQLDPGSPLLRVPESDPAEPQSDASGPPPPPAAVVAEDVEMAPPAGPEALPEAPAVVVEEPGTATDEGTEKEERIDNVLSDLRQLQDLGLPSDLTSLWLERLSSDPVSASRARYWLCRASVAERDGQLNTVLDCFKQASRAHAEPVSELISGLEDFVRRAAAAAPSDRSEAAGDAENMPPPSGGTPARSARRGDGRTPRRPLLDRSNVFDSTVIKYALVDDEPLLKKLAALRVADSEQASPLSAIITPVRRSTRRRSAKPPADPHLALFDSVEAISESLRRSALFRKNSALLSP